MPIVDDKVKDLVSKDVDADFSNLGLNGSPTQVNKSFTPPGRSGEGEILQGNPKRIS